MNIVTLISALVLFVSHAVLLLVLFYYSYKKSRKKAESRNRIQGFPRLTIDLKRQFLREMTDSMDNSAFKTKLLSEDYR